MNQGTPGATCDNLLGETLLEHCMAGAAGNGSLLNWLACLQPLIRIGIAVKYSKEL